MTSRNGVRAEEVRYAPEGEPAFIDLFFTKSKLCPPVMFLMCAVAVLGTASMLFAR